MNGKKRVNDYEQEILLTIYGKFSFVLIKLKIGQYLITFMHAAQPSVTLSVRPKKNVHLSKWSLTPDVPSPVNWNNDTAYFAFISHGSNAPPFNVTLNFKVIYIVYIDNRKVK